MAYDNTNKGALFTNDKKGNESAPDRRGSINIEGKEYWLSGWIKTPKKGGAAFLSISAQPKDEKAGEQEQPQQSGGGGMDDEIPFMRYQGSL